MASMGLGLIPARQPLRFLVGSLAESLTDGSGFGRPYHDSRFSYRLPLTIVVGKR